jgi:hypothetical protein
LILILVSAEGCWHAKECSADADCSQGAYCDTGARLCFLKPHPLQSHCSGPISDAADFYVDPNDENAGAGTGQCSFRTLTQALQAVEASFAERKTIHLAQGIYNAAGGEQFPIVVRGAISIVGAGADRTRIEGLGPVDHSQAGGSFEESFHTTLLVGNAEAGMDIEISDLSLATDSPTPPKQSMGIACDRGTTPIAGDPLPPANTRLARLKIDSNHYFAIVAGASAHPVATSCNLEVTGSELKTELKSLWAVGCGGGMLSGSTTGVPVAVRVGNGTVEGGNTFHSSPYGLEVWDCLHTLRVLRNRFEGGRKGLVAVRHSELANSFVEISDNSFFGMTEAGIGVYGAFKVDVLAGNSFTLISGDTDETPEASGLYLHSWWDGVKGPEVVRARGNEFKGNDAGILVRGELGRIDFGTPDAPGNNVFRCNSNGGALSGDVVVDTSQVSANPLMLAGNEWDHAPPTVADVSAAANGTDIQIRSSTPPNIQTDGAALSDASCPSFHVP